MPGEPKRPIIAVFDFDGTVTYADSFLPFLRHVAGFFGFWIRLLLLTPVLALHAFGVIHNSRTKEIFLKWFLRGRRPAELQLLAKSFAEKRLPALTNPIAMEKVAWHRREGHRLLLLSASPELYLEAWTRLHGFEKVVGTRLELRDGIISGRIDGHNCHGSEKVIRLEHELGALSAFEIYAYGDSRSDRLLLDRIEHAGFRSFEGRSRLTYKLTALSRFLRALI